MKKPVKQNYPAFRKQPKSTASDNTWTNYEKHVKDVKKKRSQIDTEYDKKLKVYDAEVKRRDKIKALKNK